MPQITLRVVSEADTSGLAEAEGKLGNVESAVGKLAKPAAVVGAAIVGAGLYVKGFASDAQQAIGSTEAVFGKYASTVQDTARAADQALGLSEASYNSLASTVGGSLKQAGFAEDELAGKTDDLMTAAADLASVFGGDTASATGAMGAALRGEFDSLEQFGVFLNMAAVEAELARTGQDKLTGSALDAAKKQATYNLIMEQSAQYAGNFAKEADTAAGAEQRAAAARENAAAALGSVLLPAWTALMVVMADAATLVEQHSTAVLIAVGVIGGFAAAVLLANGAIIAYNGVMKAWRVATVAMTAAQTALNAVLALNPVTLIVIAVLALVAALVLAYQNVGWFRDAVDAAAAWVADKFRVLGAAVAAAWSSAMSTAQSLARAFSAAVSAVLSTIRSLWSSTTSALSSLWSAAMSAARSVIQSFSSTISSILSTIRSLWSSTTSALRSAWAAAMSAVQTVARAFGSTVSTVLSSVRSAVNVALTVVRSIGGAFRSAGSVASGALNGVIGTIRSVISWVQSALNKIGSLKSIGSGIRSLFGSSGYVQAAVSAPRDGSPFYMTAQSVLLPAMPLASSRTGGTGPARSITVNVYGAVDPNRTARQIRDVLTRDAARDGEDDLAWN